MSRLGVMLLAAALVTAFLGFPGAPAVAVLLAVAGGLASDPEVVRTIFRAGTVLAVFFAAAVTAATVAFATDPAHGLRAGAVLLARLAVLGIATGVLATRTDAERITLLFRRVGLERAGLVIGLSLNVLPHLLQTVRQSWTALVVRAGGRRPTLRSLALLPEVLLAHTAKLADEAAAAAALRGHTALGRRPGRLPPVALAVVVTGPPGTGKTPAVHEVARRLAAAGRPVAGFVQRARYEAGVKTGFDVVSVTTGESARLATLARDGRGEAGTRFDFHSEGLELARASLRHIPAGTVVVADELGPIELRGGGHMGAVARALASPDVAAILLGVRRHLIPSLLAALDAQDAVIIDLTREGEPVEAILRALGATAGEHDARGQDRPGAGGGSEPA